jgi:hypothetical protein
MRFFTSFVASNVEGIGHAIFAAPFLPITVTQMAICVCVCVFVVLKLATKVSENKYYRRNGNIWILN